MQIGYGGVGYTTPQEAHAAGVTVATLHQGIGGIWNSSIDGTPSMVNPYINWPFVPDVVNFMEGYTREAHALDMQVQHTHSMQHTLMHSHSQLPFWGGGEVRPCIQRSILRTCTDCVFKLLFCRSNYFVQVKFYYTIRELSNHVAELFALKALQGEVLTSGDPYTIPQVGYNHAWDAHGGGAYVAWMTHT